MAYLPEFPSTLGDTSEVTRLDRFDRLAKLGQYVEVAEKAGVLDVPAETEVQVKRQKANTLRSDELSRRLWSLGYLDRRQDTAHSDSAEVRIRFQESVELFQQQANLTVDGWVGEETWTALEELVTFESTLDIEKHAISKQPTVALVRATRLRLHKLGFIRRKPGPSADNNLLPVAALDSFQKVASSIGLIKNGRDLPTVKLICLLFDQDKFVPALARYSYRPIRRKSVVFDARELSKKSSEVLATFVSRVASIELWLAGFLSEHRPSARFLTYGIQGTRFTTVDSKIRSALSKFWKTLNDTKSARHFTYATPELFQTLERIYRNSDRTPSEISAELAEKIQEQADVDLAWKEGKGLLGRVWDGIKRLWRWFRRGLKKILEVGKNAARAFLNLAMNTYRAVRYSLHEASKSLAHYLKGRIPTPGRIKVELSKDGDITVIMPNAVSSESHESGVLAIQRFGIRFALAMKLLGIVIDILKAAANRLTGWAVLVWAMVRSFKDVHKIYRNLRALDA